MPKCDFSPALSVSRRIVLESNERVAPPTPQRPRIAPLRLQRKTPPPIPPRLNELKPLKISQVQKCDSSFYMIFGTWSEFILIDIFRVW